MSTEPEVIDAETVEEGAELVPHQEAQPPTTLFRTDDPMEVVEKASRVADALKLVLTKQGMVQNIQGRPHVRVEGWQTLGSMLGVVPVVVWTRETEDGWEARVEARTLDGRVVGAAEAMCTRKEKTWAKRDPYALRSMAQTRATSKALRGPLGFVVTLAGYEATPAEEMPSDGSQRSQRGPSDKQVQFLERLIKDAGAAEHSALLVSYTAENLSGQAVSKLIDRLKNGDDDAKAETMQGFYAAAKDWAEKQPDIPADTEGL